jgi:hypothetical protein
MARSAGSPPRAIRSRALRNEILGGLPTEARIVAMPSEDLR